MMHITVHLISAASAEEVVAAHSLGLRQHSSNKSISPIRAADEGKGPSQEPT
jgi:hypothetical protein